MAEWIDLIDPSVDELREKLPRSVQESALELLLAPAKHNDEPRPTLQAHGDYIFGVFLVAVAIPDEDRLFYQEVDVVVTHDVLLSVSKTPPGEHPYDPRPARESCRPDDNAGMMLYRLVDDIAERYLDLVDALDGEIDELEDGVETSPAPVTRDRLSELRHDLLHIRRTLAPTRDAVRRVIDNVVEVQTGQEVFPHEVEVAFNSAYDKLLRAFDGLELSRDLIGSVRDYLQAKIANDQNEVMKKLTVIASVLLLPTFIVGLYGQNFRHHFPELGWQFGYAYSWGLIIATTLIQLAFFRWRKWL
ncbi:MAG: magnesium transporter CorA family protein [Actinobacteria bacterium]|nr:MAG: magnesium transporter CorA family protein [Actinomycetota bacterium]